MLAVEQITERECKYDLKGSNTLVTYKYIMTFETSVRHDRWCLIIYMNYNHSGQLSDFVKILSTFNCVCYIKNTSNICKCTCIYIIYFKC